MIKIPLNNEKRQFIEKKYWEIIEKRTKIIKNFETRQDDIKECNPKLEEFLYNNNKFCKERLKSIVLANKEAMLNYIEKFNIKSDSKSFEKNKKLIQSFFDYSRITRRNEFYDILQIDDYINVLKSFSIEGEIKILENKLHSTTDRTEKMALAQKLLEIKKGQDKKVEEN